MKKYPRGGRAFSQASIPHTCKWPCRLQDMIYYANEFFRQFKKKHHQNL